SSGRLAYAGTAGLGAWIANLVAIWFALLAFGIRPHAFGAAAVVFAVSNLVGLVQITPGNLGVFQIAVATSLTRSFGVDNTLALSFAFGLQMIEMSLGVGLRRLLLD